MYDSLCGQVVYDTTGRPYRLTRIVGRGAQGVVFEEESGIYVIKVATALRPAQREELRRRYSWLLNRKLDADTRLVVPEAILSSSLVGYVMRRVKGHQPLSALLRPDAGVSLGAFYNGKTGGLRRRLLLGKLIARAFRHLHLNGLSYCDLSDKNILVAKDPHILSICLIDPDNLSVSGKAESLVLGTPRYMAPEILKGTHQPDSLTDSYSLAIILFQLLRLGHPFIGDMVNEGPPELEERALNGELPYIDHPEDDSNRCSTILPETAVCSARLSELFRRTFIEGVTTRTRRPVPGDWEEACSSAADALVSCASCGATFIFPSKFKEVTTCVCPWCGGDNAIPPVLMFQSVTVGNGMLKFGRVIQMLVIRPGETPIANGYAFPGMAEDDRDGSSTTLIWDTARNLIHIENRGTDDLLIGSSEEGWRKRVRPGETALIHHNSLVAFGEPRENRVSRCARLYAPAFGG